MFGNNLRNGWVVFISTRLSHVFHFPYRMSRVYIADVLGMFEKCFYFVNLLQIPLFFKAFLNPNLIFTPLLHQSGVSAP